MAQRAGQLESIRGDIARSVFRAKNGIKYVAGLGRPRVGLSPRELVWTREKTRLFRYEGTAPAGRRPLIIVWSLANRSFILDLLPGQSLIAQFLGAGQDVFMIEWEPPDPVDASNTLETYVDRYIPAAISAAMDAADVDEVDVLGYCFGGTMSLLSAAANPGMPLRNLILMATPVDFSVLEGLVEVVRRGNVSVDDLVDDTGNVPPEVVYRGFAVLRPTADIFSYATLWERLWNDEFVEAYQAMGQWLSDQVPFPGGVMRDMAELMVRRNALMSGSLQLAGRRVSLTDVRCAVLNVMAEKDHIVPPASSEPVVELVGSSDAGELRIPAGHISLATGRDMLRTTAPKMIEWLEARVDE